MTTRHITPAHDRNAQMEVTRQADDIYLAELNWYEHEHEQAIKRNDHKAARYWGLRWHKLNKNEPLPF